MDNEVYANTGGQMSVNNAISSYCEIHAGGKRRRKSLGMIAATYRDVYVGPGCNRGQSNTSFKSD